MNKYLFLFLFLGFFINQGCKTEKKEKTTSNTPQMEVDESSPLIPGITEEIMLKLINECTYIDYIFRELPFSLSQNEPPSIKQNILFIDFEKPLGRIPKNCKPDGRKFFQIKGEIVYDADVYLLNGCTFYVFVDKANKPIFANYITKEGVNFYNNIIQQAQGMTN